MNRRCQLILGVGVVILAFFSAAVGRAVETEPRNDAAEVAADVNRLLAEEVPPTGGDVPRTDDATFLRRVFFDLTGAPPTADDVLVFLLDDRPEKRALLIDQLLADQDFGRNWANYWRDVIMSRRTEDRAQIAANAMTGYLAEQFNSNTPWDQIAASFITALGDVTTNGDTALILAQGGKPEETVAEISRIFLGIQIQCAQCHDHPTDRWKREQFHELAAFFPRVAVRPDRSGDRRTFLVTATDTPLRRQRKNDNRVRGTPEHYMPDLKDPQAPGTLMTPVFFVTGDKLDLGTLDAPRRETLAKLLTSKEDAWFAKAFVNRMWSELCGEGFYVWVDDIGPDREAHAPRTLDYLAAQFAEHNYDVKWLFATILQTDLYQRASRPRREPEEKPFQANVPQRLRGDQIYRAVSLALGMPEPPTPPAGPYGMGRGPRGQFAAIFGYDPSAPRDELSGTIPQAQMLMNSPMLNNLINANRGALGKILEDNSDDSEVISELYLRTVSRPPTRAEIKTCLSYVRQVDDRDEAMEDLLWSLINSTEFLYRN